MTRVLILGGGFAGVGAAQKLKDADAEVVLVDRHDYHTFQPLLYQLASGLLETTGVGHSLRDLLARHENTTIHKDTVTAVDLDARRVGFAELAPISYDYLVFGLGAQVNFFGTEGAAEHAFPMYTLPHAVRLKDHLLERWEAADRDPGIIAGRRPERRRGRGRPDRRGDGGRAGRALPREPRPRLPERERRRGADHPGRGGPGAVLDVQAEAARVRDQGPDRPHGRGEDAHRGRVGRADPGHAEVGRGAEGAHARLGRRAAGKRARPLRGRRAPAREPHRRRPRPHPAQGHPEVYVLGDVAAITDSKTGQVLPQLGSVALQSGEHAGETIARRIAGKKTKPFAYKDKGTMATIGRGAAVVQMLGGQDDDRRSRHSSRGAPCTLRCYPRTRTARRPSSTGPEPR